jgi:SAM-dependent methyltransferase
MSIDEPIDGLVRELDMTAQQSGADWDEAMWSPALARGLIRHEALRSIRHCDGYTDLLGPDYPTRLTVAQRVRMHGLSVSADGAKAVAALHLTGGHRVLDVACGPGEYTSAFASRLTGDGFVIGVDQSGQTLERAAFKNSHDRVVYMRADTLSLPFDDGAFDAVCCFGALHVLPEPLGVLREMIRVLAPLGRIAVLTSYGHESSLAGKVLALGAAMCGVHLFDRTTVPVFFAAAGLVDIEQELHGLTQLVTAYGPEQAPAAAISSVVDRRRRRSHRSGHEAHG